MRIDSGSDSYAISPTQESVNSIPVYILRIHHEVLVGINE